MALAFPFIHLKLYLFTVQRVPKEGKKWLV
jgi:hypothetical protein